MMDEGLVTTLDLCLAVTHLNLGWFSYYLRGVLHNFPRSVQTTL